MIKEIIVCIIKRSDRISRITQKIFVLSRKIRFNKIKKPIIKEIKINRTKFKMLVNPKNELLEEILYLGEKYEEEISEIIKKHGNRKKSFIDIGANIGYHSLYASPQYKEVISFEPVKKTFKQFRESIKINKFKNIKAYNLACSNNVRTTHIQCEEGTHNASTIKENKTKNTTKIRTTSLDEFLKKHYKKIGLIKIDVEGHEWQVIEGMKKIIETATPPIIIEFIPKFLDKQKGNQRINLLRYLNKHYKLTHIEKRKRIKNVERYANYIKNWVFVSNVLLIPRKEADETKE